MARYRNHSRMENRQSSGAQSGVMGRSYDVSVTFVTIAFKSCFDCNSFIGYNRLYSTELL